MRLLARQPRKPSTRGVTLIEVMIVILIMGLIASGVAVAVMAQTLKAQKQSTAMNAIALRQFAAFWRSAHGTEECPSPERLRADKVIDVSTKLTDAWGSPFVVECSAEETSVVSPGPDKRPNTEDDIREPDPSEGKVASR